LDKRPKLRKMDIRFGAWSVKSLYRAGLLTTVAKEMSVRFKIGYNVGSCEYGNGSSGSANSVDFID
jgi:hypothetical protein